MAAHYMHSSQDRLRRLTEEMDAARGDGGGDAGDAGELESLRRQLEESNRRNAELIRFLTESYGAQDK